MSQRTALMILVLRVGEERGLRIFRRLSEVPGCASTAEPRA